jgi:5-oxoprolinase (ATP-hydrolysing) subunit A
MRSIDINCDMGESFGAWKMGSDSAIMPHITSANIACGAHAGDPQVMAATVRMAKVHGVAAGAHPGYPDLLGFGRRRMSMADDELKYWILVQLGALAAVARAEGVELSHVKPHGALYNVACADRRVAATVAQAVRSFSTTLPIFCLPNSFLEAEARENGLSAVREGFCDRAYEPDGSLADRSLPGAVRGDPHLAAGQAAQLAAGRVTSRDGSVLSLQVETVCVHGDTPGAPEIAAAVRKRLESEGYAVAAPSAAGIPRL